MGRRSDFSIAKKHLVKEYEYGVLDQIVFVGETTYQGGPEFYFKNGWPAFKNAPILNPDLGTVSNARSTSNSSTVSIAYAWYKSNSTLGNGWLYLVWCRRGIEYRKFIEGANGKGAGNEEVVMVSIAGYHILGARQITRNDEDKDGGAVLGKVVENPKSKLKERDPYRFGIEMTALRNIQDAVTGLLDIAAKL